jgi:copper chaperone CopZ
MKKSLVLLASSLLASASALAGTIEMTVNGLVCAFCAQGIEKTLRKNPATADVVVSLEQRLVAVSTKEGQDISDVTLTKALTDAGYNVKAIKRTDTPLTEIRARLSKARHKGDAVLPNSEHAKMHEHDRHR